MVSIIITTIFFSVCKNNASRLAVAVLYRKNSIEKQGNFLYTVAKTQNIEAFTEICPN